MNSNAQIFGGFIVFLSVVALVIGLVQLTSVRDALAKELGDDQIELLRAYSEGENARLYLDEAVRHTATQVFPELYRNAFNQGCFEEDGILFWSNDSELCIPLDSDISLHIRTSFAAELNTRLSAFKHSPILSNISSADLRLDQTTNTLQGIPFDPAVVDDHYSVLMSFSTHLPKNLFSLNADELFVQINQDCASQEDVLLTQCIAQVLNTTAVDSSGWYSGESCEQELLGKEGAAFHTFVTTYNDCARSLDDECSCEFNEAHNLEYVFDEKSMAVSFKDKIYPLVLPFAGDISGSYVKEDKYIVGKKAEELQSLPVCRLNDRTVTLCLKEDGVSLFRVGMVVEDRAAPLAVTVIPTTNSYTWQPSASGDVEEYVVYIAKKGLAFALDGKPDATVAREKNRGDNLSYTIDPQQFDIKVFAVDDVRNRG